MFDEVQFTILSLLLLVFCFLSLCIILDLNNFFLLRVLLFFLSCLGHWSILSYVLYKNEKVGVQLHCYICEYLFWMSLAPFVEKTILCSSWIILLLRWKLGDSKSECFKPHRAREAPAAPRGRRLSPQCEGVPGLCAYVWQSGVRWRNSPSQPLGSSRVLARPSSTHRDSS